MVLGPNDPKELCGPCCHHIGDCGGHCGCVGIGGGS